MKEISVHETGRTYQKIEMPQTGVHVFMRDGEIIRFRSGTLVLSQPGTALLIKSGGEVIAVFPEGTWEGAFLLENVQDILVPISRSCSYDEPSVEVEHTVSQSSIAS